MFNVRSYEAKNRVSKFDNQKMNTFKSVSCLKCQISIPLKHIVALPICLQNVQFLFYSILNDTKVMNQKIHCFLSKVENLFKHPSSYPC